MPALRELLIDAVRRGVSDVHIKAGGPPFFRISSQLTAMESPAWSGEDLADTLRRILPEHLRIRFQECREADFSLMEPGCGRFRVNAFQSGEALNLVLRHVPSFIPTIESLNLPPFLKTLAHEPRGIILACGTTGSGKSTSLAAILNEINHTERRRIITIEDPVEFQFTDDQCLISQREIGTDTRSFPDALKHVLRQDPDVIMIGEMRDVETFQAALSAAETGHIVFSTLHAGTAAQAIPRILDMCPSSERESMRAALAESIRCIFCQRLIPSVRGGVRPAVEIMTGSPTVRKMIHLNQLERLQDAIETGADDHMQTFNQSIYQLIRKAEISEADGMRFAGNPESLKMNLKGIFLDESRRILSK
ncbi:MAG: PilT/PilU family type 4a pilus ATPase [Kiritimatiellia bacterium]|nr:PilT/PilU family type 4a pilus ATPase [Kiritimatiellia bacterium]